MKNKTLAIIVSIFIVGLGFLAFYWLGIRPTQIRASCQKEVDDALTSTLTSNGFYKDGSEKWVRQDERCVEQEAWPGESSGVSSITWIFKDLGKCIKAETKMVEPDPDDLAKDKKSAEEIYKPCLQRHGMRS